MTDVVNQNCRAAGCRRRATHNHSGEKAEWCAKHKTPDMVDTSYKRCEQPDCAKWPLYAFPGEKARFCR